jgi:hypothetical protein
VRSSGLLTKAVERRCSGTMKRAAASGGVLTGAWPPTTLERRSWVHEHGE